MTANALVVMTEAKCLLVVMFTQGCGGGSTQEDSTVGQYLMLGLALVLLRTLAGLTSTNYDASLKN